MALNKLLPRDRQRFRVGACLRQTTIDACHAATPQNAMDVLRMVEADMGAGGEGRAVRVGLVSGFLRAPPACTCTVPQREPEVSRW